MSLHNLAKHIQSQGRGEDSVLIHVTPGEVGALQKLAMANGGSLTINPHTGLPEAGFLKDWLPAIVGIALTPFTGGMSLPMTMALVGGATALTSLAVGNSLEKSLFSGLTSGAGSGLGAGLGALGAEAGAAAATKGATSAVAPVFEQAGAKGLGNLASSTGISGAARGATQALPTAEQAFTLAGTKYASPYAAQVAQQATTAPTLTGTQLYKAAAAVDRPGMVSEGLGRALTEPGVGTQFVKDNTGKLVTLGTGMIGRSMYSTPANLQQPPAQKSTYAGPYSPTVRTYVPNTQPLSNTSEHVFFNDINPYPGALPYPGTVSAAGGGLMGLAEGGGGYDDEPGHDGYADGGDVQQKPQQTQQQMPVIDLSAIQNYVQSIGRAQAQPPEQVPQILARLKAAQSSAPQQTSTSEQNYGFKPITVAVLPPKPTAPVDQYAAYRPQTVDVSAPGATTKTTTQYTPLQNYVYNPDTQQMEAPMASGGLAGMVAMAGGGRYLDGPGDGVSDSIPATIDGRQPARLARGEFVIPARTVSELGNGSSSAGAERLEKMVKNIEHSRKKVKRGKDGHSARYLPA